MARRISLFGKPRIDPVKLAIGGYYPEPKKRKPFSTSTKKREWMRAGNRDPFGKFVKISRCRVCKIPLRWGDRNYEFDHKNNDSSDNSQKNCFLVCLKHHRRATKIKKIKIRDRWTRATLGHKTIKLKVGYKKSRKKKYIRKRKHSRGTYWINPLTGRKEKVQPLFRL